MTPHCAYTYIVATGSKGGHSYGWAKRQYAFQRTEVVVLPSTPEIEVVNYGRVIWSKGLGGINGGGAGAARASW